MKTYPLRPILTVRDLIHKVSGINWTAGAWISKNRTENRKLKPGETLTKLFIWKDSPQGFLFWRGINEKLRVYYTLPTGTGTEQRDGKRKRKGNWTR